MDKSKIAARIKALLAKTTENGCTEDEAMSAAAMARKLMDQYQIDLGAIGMEADGVKKEKLERGTWKTLKVSDWMQMRVAEFCDVKTWKNRSNDELVFFGLTSDVDFACWLNDSLFTFVTQSAVRYMAGNPALPTGFKMPKWEAEKAFLFGIVARINERLKEATVARKQQMAQGTGTSLIVVKGAIVTKAFADLGMKLHKGAGSSAKAFDDGAYRAGQAAGDGASFGKPVNAGAGVLRIRGRRDAHRHIVLVREAARRDRPHRDLAGRPAELSARIPPAPRTGAGPVVPHRLAARVRPALCRAARPPGRPRDRRQDRGACRPPGCRARLLRTTLPRRSVVPSRPRRRVAGRRARPRRRRVRYKSLRLPLDILKLWRGLQRP